MTPLEFEKLAKEGYNRIPIILETLADLETPLSLYMKLTQHEGSQNTFLLESVVGGERFGRYSIIGLPAKTLVRIVGTPDAPKNEVLLQGQVIETNCDNPLEFIESYLARFRAAIKPGLPRFCGGLAGYFGFDTVRYIEPKLAQSTPQDELHLPDIQLLLTEELAVIDNLAGKLYFIVYANPDQDNAYQLAKQRLSVLRSYLDKPIISQKSLASTPTQAVRQFSKSAFMASVQKTQEYILAGDCMQVVISQRISQPFQDSALNLYRALRALNPSPYLYFYDFGDHQLVGSSPEILVRQESHPQQGTNSSKRMVTVRPLAGTRPRGKNPEEDAMLGAELLADPKEIAEHATIVDLIRNDLSRVSQHVKVTKYRYYEEIQTQEGIIGQVSSMIEGSLPYNYHEKIGDIIFKLLPAGSISGAPKNKTLQIIHQAENTERGYYTGVAGYFDGVNLESCVLIRYLQADNTYRSGGGITSQSDLIKEYQEMIKKVYVPFF